MNQKQLIYDVYEAFQGLNRGLAYSAGLPASGDRTDRGSASPKSGGDKKRSDPGGEPQRVSGGSGSESELPPEERDNYPERVFWD